VRSLEIDPSNSDAMTYFGFVITDEAIIAESMDDSARLRAEATDWYRKVDLEWPPGLRQELRHWFQFDDKSSHSR
jgi:hypothetical protein